MHYILIILMATNNNGIPAVSQAEYNTVEACQSAAKAVEDMSNDLYYVKVRTICAAIDNVNI